ncbi:MAG: hypothetical protein JEZ11_18645 [Desulfobacterales bacterium]|nr:hypothetical protein [Desulfobacterales bacterium]
MTFTLIQTARTKKRGYLTGLWVISGHAMLEMAIICALLLGFSTISLYFQPVKVV